MGADACVHPSDVDGGIFNEQNGADFLDVVGRRRPNSWISIGLKNVDEHQPKQFCLAAATFGVLRDALRQHPAGVEEMPTFTVKRGRFRGRVGPLPPRLPAAAKERRPSVDLRLVAGDEGRKEEEKHLARPPHAQGVVALLVNSDILLVLRPDDAQNPVYGGCGARQLARPGGKLRQLPLTVLDFAQEQFGALLNDLI